MSKLINYDEIDAFDRFVAAAITGMYNLDAKVLATAAKNANFDLSEAVAKSAIETATVAIRLRRAILNHKIKEGEK